MIFEGNKKASYGLMQLLKSVLVLLFFCLPLWTYAQQNVFPKLSINGQANNSPVSLKKLKIEVELIGNVSRTTFELTYHNQSAIVLEGMFEFPLGDKQNVSRFAMDVNGKLREGVVVEKEKGTQTFEAIVRSKVDPGLLEKTQGNNFKSRIYPLNPKSDKLVVIAFEQELPLVDKHYLYQLPLGITESIPFYELSIKCSGIDSLPVFEQNEACTFTRNGNVFSYFQKKNNFCPSSAIGFRILPPSKRENVLAYKGAVDSASYFYAQIAPTALSEKKPKPKNISIYMDASGSSANQDFGQITSFLDAYFQYLGKANVSLYSFADRVAEKHSFKIRNGGWEKLRKTIINTAFDGASQLGKLDFKKEDTDEIILITDGLSNYGNDQINLSAIPVLVINASKFCDHAYLARIAYETSGAYIHLNSSSIENALECSVYKNLSVKSITVEQGVVNDIFCEQQINSNHSFSIAGKIQSATAIVKIDFGYNDMLVCSERIRIDNQNPAKNALVERIWVNKKIDDLDSDRKKNKNEVTQLGKRFSIVTPNTSLIVLENAEDYMKYDIAPPDELKEAYNKIPKPEKQDLQKLKKEQMDDALKDFSEKMKWTKISWPDLVKKRQRESDSMNRISDIMNRIYMRNKAKQDSINRVKYELAEKISKAREDSLARAHFAEKERFERMEYNDQWQTERVNSKKFKIISGVVYSKIDKEPIVGAAIRAKGTINGTITDLNGRFDLRVPVNADVVFSCIGFQYVKINVAKKKRLKLYLREETTTLDAVNIVGYATQRKSTITSSIQSINASDNNNKVDQNDIDPFGEYVIFIPDLHDSVYLKVLKNEKRNEYAVYLKLKAQWGKVPSFYLGAADYFFSIKDKVTAFKVLSNLAEINLDDHELLKVLGKKLLEFGAVEDAIHVFQRIIDLRPFDPQSYLDLGLAYEENKEYQKALDWVYEAITRPRSDDIVNITRGIDAVLLTELNHIIAKAGGSICTDAIDKRFLKDISCDIRIVADWNAGNTFFGLVVNDPNKETCNENNPHTQANGFLTNENFSACYLTEFTAKKAIKGSYCIGLEYLESFRQTVNTPVFVQIRVFTNYGRVNEKMKIVNTRFLKQKTSGVLYQFNFNE